MLSMSNQEISDTLDVVLKAAESAKARAERIVHKNQLNGNFEDIKKHLGTILMETNVNN